MRTRTFNIIAILTIFVMLMIFINVPLLTILTILIPILCLGCTILITSKDKPFYWVIMTIWAFISSIWIANIFLYIH